MIAEQYPPGQRSNSGEIFINNFVLPVAATRTTHTNCYTGRRWQKEVHRRS